VAAPERAQREWGNSTLQVLVGEKLSSITFVLDYWQLDFDGHGITVWSKITVKCADRVVSSGELGFRDCLCEQIAKIVRSVEFQDGQGVLVSFADGGTIHLSAHPEDYRGPEAIMVQLRDKTWWVV
jgi:hypothetical protein